MMIAIRAGWLSHVVVTQPPSPNPKLLLVLHGLYETKEVVVNLVEESWRCDH